MSSSVISTQIEEHKKYGGVVPEIASRRHCENILGVVRQALDEAQVTLADLDGIAVTYAPGLIGALLVGVSFAKALAMSCGKPLIPVHHIAGHIATNYLTFPELEPPYLCLVASGGHSHIIEVLSYTKFRVVGRTRDDAAGECLISVPVQWDSRTPAEYTLTMPLSQVIPQPSSCLTLQLPEMSLISVSPDLKLR